MAATILDGKALAKEIRAELAVEAADFIQDSGVVPCLAAVLVGDDPASEVYVRNKQKACDRVGIESRLQRLPEDTSMEELLTVVNRLNEDDAVHGILVQLPLPEGLDETRILDAVSPLKDVDAFHPENVGLIVQNRPRFLPCTPHGIQQLLLASQDRDRRGQRRRARPQRHRRQADGHHAHAARPRRRRHGHGLPQPHEEPGRSLPRRPTS